MGKKKKSAKSIGVRGSDRKTTKSQKRSTDIEKVVWLFDWLDRDGEFAFDVHRNDFNCCEFLEKMITYSNMTWLEIKQQTHDNGKSKHHILDESGISQEAKQRIRVRGLEDYSDSIFSFALQNKLRVIGVRSGEKFHVVWYDPKHRFYPVGK